jgi:hypothetical protein
MSLIRINVNPSGRQLAVFAAAWLVFLGCIGAENWHHGRQAAAGILWTLACLVPLVGLFSRAALRFVFVGLSYATRPIGIVVSFVVLALVYYLALTPIGWAMRLLRHDPLSRRFEPDAGSYWNPRDAKKPIESYFNQS